MELLQLAYFCDAAECENFSHTAAKYNVPPSNISQTVKRLELELGAKLFRRTANRISLTEEGRIFYESARRALSILSDARSKLRDRSEDIGGELRLLILTNRRIVTLAIEKLKKLAPLAQITINHDTGAPFSDFDLIITDSEEQSARFVSEPLINERILLAVPKSSHLSSLSCVELSSLSEERFVSMSDNARLTKLCTDLCRAAGFTPNVAISTSDPYYVRKYVEMGLGIALFPELSWYGLFADEVSILTIGDYTRMTYLHSRSDKAKSRLEQLFSDILKETFRAESRSISESENNL